MDSKLEIHTGKLALVVRSHELHIIFFMEVLCDLFHKEWRRLVHRCCSIDDMHTILLSKYIISFDDLRLEFFKAFDDILTIADIHACLIVLEWIAADGALSSYVDRDAKVEGKIWNRKVCIIKWLEMLHLQSSRISTSECGIHISIAEYDHTSTQRSAHLSEISLYEVGCIYRIKYCCRHMSVRFFELFLHLMDLRRRVPDTMHTEKSI